MLLTAPTSYFWRSCKTMPSNKFGLLSYIMLLILNILTAIIKPGSDSIFNCITFNKHVLHRLATKHLIYLRTEWFHIFIYVSNWWSSSWWLICFWVCLRVRALFFCMFTFLKCTQLIDAHLQITNNINKFIAYIISL